MGDWTRENDTGSSGYTRAELERVVAIPEQHRGERNAVSRKDVCQSAHVEGRTLRAITAAIDLDESLPLVVGYDMHRGTIWARAAMQERDGIDEQLEASAKSLMHRLSVRRRKLARACAAQPLMPGFETFVGGW